MKPAFATLPEVAAAALAAGTPCYVYGPRLAAERMRQLMAAMRAASPKIEVAYAVKANPRPEFLSALAATGCDFDVASHGEFDRVVAQGVEGRRMVFSGPGKSETEVRAALEHGVRLNAEGERDLRMAAAFGKERGTRVRVNLRVNPGGGTAGNIIGGAGPSRFGVDEALLPEVLDRWAAHPHVEVRGVQVFTASNVLSVQDLANHHRKALTIAAGVRARKVELDTVDLGGGLGIPYADAEPELDVAALARALGELAGDSVCGLRSGRVLLEPGRWVAGPCGAYVARVLEVKHSQGVRFAVIDGGIHHLVRPALIKVDQPCAVVRPGHGALPVGGPPTTFGGPLCTGIDILARDADVGDVQEGDLVVFMQAGAYGETEAMPDFLLHPRPKIAVL